ncbi:MAG: polysaccharide pyruvyl transferase family protein [Clostridiales bacterium]|nr:polysaccharide pyruvyl transferase family protein [Clostridiales bacterium]
MKKSIQAMKWNLAGTAGGIMNRLSYPLQKDNGKVFLFDTSIDTDNLGDFIIMKYCGDILHSIFTNHQFVCVPTHTVPSDEQEAVAKSTKYKFVCGTNLLTSHIEEHWNWRLPDGIRRKFNYRNTILLGAGWKGYQGECSAYSRMAYHCILNPNVIHSVRDSYTEQQLCAAGISNVINTGCPTMWRLTPEFCKTIPVAKATKVVTTITDYRRDAVHDQMMLDILSRNYECIYLWIQGDNDEEYLTSLNVPANLVKIPHSLGAYEEILNRGCIDYVGTRLHAGIFALNHQIRSIILAVDNRAIEMGKDTNLPVILRENIEDELEVLINAEFETNIRLPHENIDCFLNQFMTKEPRNV